MISRRRQLRNVIVVFVVFYTYLNHKTTSLKTSVREDNFVCEREKTSIEKRSVMEKSQESFTELWYVQFISLNGEDMVFLAGLRN